MRLRFQLAMLLLAACGAAFAQSARPEQTAPARTELIDRIVAVVNKEVITQYELAERMNRVRKELERRGTSLPDRGEIERQVLERLIIEKVQLQYARETGVRVDDLELDRTVSRVAEGNKLSLTEFRKTLERDAINFDGFREELRNEILMNRLRDREVTGKITVSEGEIENLLLEQGERKDIATEYNIAHILVRVPEQASPEQLETRRARAEEAVKRLKDGADFAQLAAAYSDAPDALQGGVLGWRSQQRLPELYVEALAALKPGDISGVFRSPAGFHVLKLLELRGAGAPLLVEQAHVRHILIRTNELVSEDEAKRKLLSLRERIVNGVNFAELARLNSDDGSASRGGDLGWIYPGDTVAEFERAFTELKPMDVSQPVKTPFGWHLIQVLERRTADMSSERKRLEARKALLDRKGDEAYQEWLRQLRDRAYVEMRLEER
ncbi:MAG TPA: peptidylprolyl isomerase [Burkholderiales bacterium]|nr:peptidylprolyl isomerase [Burkholderiales bacterium]